MRRLVRVNSGGKSSRLRSANPTTDFGAKNLSDDYEAFFKQLFCVAASDLAALLNESLENLGVLFGEILKTGTTVNSTGLNFFSNWRTTSSSLDTAEQGRSHLVLGRGQLLVLVRRISRSDAAKLQAIGYRFAHVVHVVGSLARGLEVTPQELLPKLKMMSESAGKEILYNAGVHLACFAVRPVFRKGFDVLVLKEAKNLLPTHKLPGSRLAQYQFDFLKRLDGMTVSTCLTSFRRKTVCRGILEERFAEQLFDALSILTAQIEEDWFREAKLTARVVIAPSPHIGGKHRLEYASVIAFRVVTDVHSVGKLDPTYEYIPSNFFLNQQRVYRGLPDNEYFAQEVLKDFGEQAHRAEEEARAVSRQGSFYSVSLSRQSSRLQRSQPKMPRRSWPFRHVNGKNVISDYSSQRSLVTASANMATVDALSSNMDTVDASPDNNPVAKGISIEVNNVHQGSSQDIEMADLSGCSNAFSLNIERNTFAELLAFTVGERKKLRQNALAYTAL